MNYHRKQWEEKKKSNPYAKKLREHKPQVIPDKRSKINLKNIEKFIDEDE